MKLQHLVALALISVPAAPSFGAEVDQFTRRNEPLEDSAEMVNKKANDSVQSALRTLNQKGSGCEEETLYPELRKYFANHMKGIFIIDLLEDKTLPKRVIDLNNTVFQDWRMFDGLGLGLVLRRKSDVVMSPIIRLGDHMIGTDKLEHMFGQGFSYFTTNYLKGKGPIKAVKGGALREKLVLGGGRISNGVFSYADLSANFNGMRFWNHMLQLREDILGPEHNVGPYIACENNKWVQVKKIDFSYYADASMDEGINCSQFPRKKTAEKYIKRVKADGLTCPVDRSSLEDMIVKYKQMSKWIINTHGNGVVNYEPESQK